jgi:streptogramin lyase
MLLTLNVGTFPAPPVAVATQDVVKGSDGNLWFTEPGIGRIGRITPQGVLTEFPLPPGHDVEGAITSGPDGNLWFTETNAVGQITPSGVVTEFTVSPQAHLSGITSGSDGNLWFMDTPNNKIGRISTSGTMREVDIPPALPLSTADGVHLIHDITSGPDGNVWYVAEGYNHRLGTEFGEIGRVTPAGQVSVYTLKMGPAARHQLFNTGHTKPTGGMLADAITAGPDGNVWFTEHQANGNAAVGKITTTGKITQYPIPTVPRGAKTPDVSTDITAGPDGNLWFNLAGDDFLNGPAPAPYVGRVTPTGQVHVYAIPDAKDDQAAVLAEGAESITTGPDGKLWFTGSTRRFISQTGRVIGTITPPAK